MTEADFIKRIISGELRGSEARRVAIQCFSHEAPRDNSLEQLKQWLDDEIDYRSEIEGDHIKMAIDISFSTAYNNVKAKIEELESE